MTNRAKIITVTSMKGGVGKTVIASLLARYYTEMEGKKVLVVDFDPRAGITSLLYNKPINTNDMTIAELMRVAFEQGNILDVYYQSVRETGLEKNKHWKDNGGKLLLLPSKPALESVLRDKDTTLLKYMLHNLELTDEYVILVDTGSDSNCVLLGTCAADVVFLPMIYSKQDVHPAVETLRTIILEQRENGHAVLGGLVINQGSGAKWEQEYHDNYVQLFDRFKEKVDLKIASDNLFIHLDVSRTIKRGTFMDWAIRDDYLAAAQQMAAAVQAVDVN